MTRAGRATAIAVLASLVVGGSAAATGDDSTARYRKSSGPGPRVVIVRDRCLAAEDSAGEVFVRSYEGQRVVLDCRSRY